MQDVSKELDTSVDGQWGINGEGIDQVGGYCRVIEVRDVGLGEKCSDLQ